jgi:hypothetical protein
MWSSANTHGYRDNYAHGYCYGYRDNYAHGYGYRDAARRRGPNGNTHANQHTRGAVGLGPCG